MSGDARVVYVYGIVPAALAADGAPRGLDDKPVEAIVEGALAALASRVDAGVYEQGHVERRLGDVTWLGPRAVAHDAVVTWAGERGGVIPLPMFALYRDETGVRRMLRERGSALERTLDRVAPGQEYAVRLFRLEDALLQHVGALSPRIAGLERQAEAASPGQRYLLGRKLESERRTEARRLAAQVAREVYETLAPHALEGVREPLPRGDAEQAERAAGVAVLNAFFLVRRGGIEPFQTALTALAARYEPVGFRVEFTGPWPPYHFVAEGT